MYVFMYVCGYIYVCIYLCMFMYVCLSMYVCNHASKYVCVCVCVCMYVHICVMCTYNGLHIREFLTLACRGIRGFPRLVAMRMVQVGLCIGA
jgi:hypothetical protein